MHEQNGYLILAHLSDIELYYTPSEFVESEKITLQAEEFHHAVNVMRNSVGDFLHITDGEGTIYRSEIVNITKSNLTAAIKDKFKYENLASNIWFCIPQLKNPDRLKFAFEKCVELGITNFILFNVVSPISSYASTISLGSLGGTYLKIDLFIPIFNISSIKINSSNAL